MKKIILSIAVIFSVTLFASAQKYAFIDSEYIMENIPSFTAAQEQLNQLSGLLRRWAVKS
jgi:outer membrane protein